MHYYESLEDITKLQGNDCRFDSKENDLLKLIQFLSSELLKTQKKLRHLDNRFTILTDSLKDEAIEFDKD